MQIHGQKTMKVQTHNEGLATSALKNIEGNKLLFSLHAGDTHKQRIVQKHNQGLSTFTLKNIDQNNLPFVLHNTTDTVTVVDDAFLKGYQKPKCPRCKKLAEQGRKLSKKHPVIDINDISGICDHCKTNELSKVCHDCTCALRKYLVEKKNYPGEYVPAIESWLSKTEKKLKQTGHCGLHPKAESKLVLEEIAKDASSTFSAILFHDQKQGAKELTGKEIKKSKINIDQVRGKKYEDKDFKYLFPGESVKKPQPQISSFALFEKTRKTLHIQAEKKRISNEEKQKRNKISEEKKKKKLEESKKKSKKERENSPRSGKTESSEAIIQLEDKTNIKKQTETLVRPTKSENYQETKSKEAKNKISEADNKKIPETHKEKPLEHKLKKERTHSLTQEGFSPKTNTKGVGKKSVSDTKLKKEGTHSLTQEGFSPKTNTKGVGKKSASDTKLNVGKRDAKSPFKESNLASSDGKTVRAKSDLDGINKKNTMTIKPAKSKINTAVAEIVKKKSDISKQTKIQEKTSHPISDQQTKAKLLLQKADLLKKEKEKEAASKARQAEKANMEKQKVDMKSIKVAVEKDHNVIAIKGGLKAKMTKAVPSPDLTEMLSKSQRVESSDSDSDSDVADYHTTIKNIESVTKMILKQRILNIDVANKKRPVETDKGAILFKTVDNVDDDSEPATETKSELGEKASETRKTQPEEGSGQGIIKYALSDKSYIDKGWTVLPVQTVYRKMNVYRMRPAHPEFDWFEHNKHKGQMLYDTSERLAEFDENGRGTWYYRNGNIALEYYDAEGPNADRRIVVYSSGEPDDRGRSQAPRTILATFDYNGNGIVFDHSGKIRLKYNQTEGVVLDKSLGPVTHWQWHSLNDPPVLQQVMIDTTLPSNNESATTQDKALSPSPDNEAMCAIEYENLLKEKRRKISETKYKPFQIKMKALKVNENFSLRVLDQAKVHLLFRDGSTNLKLNLGMILDDEEIVDTDMVEVGKVTTTVEQTPAQSESLAALQMRVAEAQKAARAREAHIRFLQPPLPPLPPMPPLPPRNLAVYCRGLTPSQPDCCARRSCTTQLYYDNRLM